MKIYLICTLYFLCGFQVAAQMSSYFLVEKSKSDTIIYLKAKELVLTEVEQPCNNQYWFVYPKEMKLEVDSLIQETFKGINPEDISLLDGLNFNVFFDNQYKMIYYLYSLPKDHANELKKIDRQLYEFAQKFKQIDLERYIKMYDEKAFKQASFGILDFKRRYNKKK